MRLVRPINTATGAAVVNHMFCHHPPRSTAEPALLSPAVELALQGGRVVTAVVFESRGPRGFSFAGEAR